MAGEHPPENRDGGLLRLCMGASEADQASGAMLASGQGTKMGSHVTQVATCGESGPFLCRRVLQAIVPVVRVVQTAHRLAILFYKSGGIELGVDHDRVRGGMAEQSL